MSDKEFIEFLWRLYWDYISDGNSPTDDEWNTLLAELTNRKILNGEFPE